MATFSGLLNPSVFSHYNGNPMLSFRCQMLTRKANTRYLTANKFVPKLSSWPKIDTDGVKRVRPLFSMSRGGSYGIKFDDEYEEDPFWLYLYKETIRALRLMFAFLVQQPGQLKYIEWPSFQDTFRTATLTLVLVAALIVALCSIDSALSYVLALLLRKSA